MTKNELLKKLESTSSKINYLRSIRDQKAEDLRKADEKLEKENGKIKKIVASISLSDLATMAGLGYIPINIKSMPKMAFLVPDHSKDKSKYAFLVWENYKHAHNKGVVYFETTIQDFGSRSFRTVCLCSFESFSLEKESKCNSNPAKDITKLVRIIAEAAIDNEISIVRTRRIKDDIHYVKKGKGVVIKELNKHGLGSSIIFDF